MSHTIPTILILGHLQREVIISKDELRQVHLTRATPKIVVQGRLCCPEGDTKEGQESMEEEKPLYPLQQGWTLEIHKLESPSRAMPKEGP